MHVSDACVSCADLLETCSQVRKAGGKCHQYVVDITDKEAVYSTAEDILRQYKKVILNVCIHINYNVIASLGICFFVQSNCLNVQTISERSINKNNNYFKNLEIRIS